MAPGRLIGVGVGPGDPELMTLRAVRAIGEADVVAWFAKAGNASHARAIAAKHFRSGAVELPLLYPVTTEIAKCHPAYDEAIAAFFDDAAAVIAGHLDRGAAVAVLSEGDPFFYGSYMHIHLRLAPRYPAVVIAGVTSLSGCWSAAGLPIAQGEDVLTVLPGTLSEDELQRRLASTDAAVVIKLGRNLPKLRRVLAAAKRLAGAVYVERGTMADASVIALSDKTDDVAPYFAIILVPGWRTKP